MTVDWASVGPLREPNPSSVMSRAEGQDARLGLQVAQAKMHEGGIMLKFIVAEFAAISLCVAPCYGAESSGGLIYGNNIWGNSLGLCLDVPISESWVVQLGYGTGYFNFSTTDQGDFLFLENLPGDEHRVTLELKQTVDISLSYRRHEVRHVHLFNEFGAGITHVLVRFKSEYERSDAPGTFKAEKDYSRYGIFVSLNVLDVEPHVAGGIAFSLGVRSRLVWLDSPQVLNYTNGAGWTEKQYEYARHGDTLYYPYPEMFLAARYRF